MAKSEKSFTVQYLDARKNAKKRQLLFTRLISLFAALIGVGVSLATLFFLMPRLSGIKYSPSFEYEVAKFHSHLSDLDTEVDKLQKAMATVTHIDTATPANTQIAALQTGAEQLTNRVTTLEKGLLNDPEKALSVPLLRMDLENVKKQYLRDMESYAKSIDRVYDENKWFIGLMFTMALGLIGLAISSFVQSRRLPEHRRRRRRAERPQANPLSGGDAT